MFEKYPELQARPEEYEMTRDELFELQWKRVKLVNEVAGEWITNASALGKNFVGWAAGLQNGSPIALHSSMFTNSMDFLTSEEQRKKYLPLCDNLNILGCYA